MISERPEYGIREKREKKTCMEDVLDWTWLKSLLEKKEKEEREERETLSLPPLGCIPPPEKKKKDIIVEYSRKREREWAEFQRGVKLALDQEWDRERPIWRLW